MPCPSGDHLCRDIDAYQMLGVGTVVSMLAKDEAAMLGLADEAVECQRVGISFISCPIADFGLPDPSIYDALTDQIADMVRDGQKVAVHCRAGIGRSGMVTAGTLIALGYDAEKAIAKVAHARGVSIPDTVEQGKFIANSQVRRMIKIA